MTEHDETAYLLNSKANAQRLQESLAQAGRGEHEGARGVADSLAEEFFDEKVAPGMVAKGIDADRLAKVRAQFLIDVVKARAELRAYSRAPRRLRSGVTTDAAEIEAMLQTARESADDEVLAERYFNEHVLPGLTADGLPSDVLAQMRENYIVDALASPLAREQLREMYREGS